MKTRRFQELHKHYSLQRTGLLKILNIFYRDITADLTLIYPLKLLIQQFKQLIIQSFTSQVCFNDNAFAINKKITGNRSYTVHGCRD